jgi:hypothetical protein
MSFAPNYPIFLTTSLNFPPLLKNFVYSRSIPDEIENAEYWADVYSGWVSPGDNPMEPVSDIIYPVIDKLDRIQITEGDNDMSVHKIVAVLSSSFYWRDVLKNILPTGRNGMVIVIDNPCKTPFTYQIK